MHKRSGFSLIEILVTLALIAVLAAVALPSFQHWYGNVALRSKATLLRSDLSLARQVALDLPGAERALVCPSSDGVLCSSSVSDWGNNWLIFVDQDGDHRRGLSEPLVKLSAGPRSLSSDISVVFTPEVSSDTGLYLSFRGAGGMSPAGAFLFCRSSHACYCVGISATARSCVLELPFEDREICQASCD